MGLPGIIAPDLHTQHQAPPPIHQKEKSLLLEDLPNLSHMGTLLVFTALNQILLIIPPLTIARRPAYTALIIIISEYSESAGASTAVGISAHRVLGTPILPQPLTSSIEFRRIAKTSLVKCMDEVLKRERFQEC